MDLFVKNAIDFLSQHYDVSAPRIVLSCEDTCQWAGECHYLACYMPWLNQVNFKSDSEIGYIVAHEFGHHLEEMGMIENGEPGAYAFEKWWLENVSEMSCEICGSPIFVSEDTIPGTEIMCEECGSVYEAVNFSGIGRPDAYVITRKQLLAATILTPIIGVVFSGFVFDTLPRPGLDKGENIKRSRATVGSLAVSGFLGSAAYLLAKGETV